MTSPEEIRVLVIDDDPKVRELLTAQLEPKGFVVESTNDGTSGWERLERDPVPDVVLLDWSMPGLSGLELLGRVREEERLDMVPVILQTARDRQEDVRAGIEAGAHYYVTKPFHPPVLEAMVRSAAEDHRRHREQRQALQQGIAAIATLRRGRFRYRTVDQGVALGRLLARACPDPETTAVGLGELLINAVEHGNLGITYEDKTRLLEEGSWDEEVERRLALPENREKVVTVDFERRGDEIHLTIADQGPGFDWKPYLSIAPSRAFDRHGRGIALARKLSFHHLEFQPPGNVVTAVVAPEVTETPTDD